MLPPINHFFNLSTQLLSIRSKEGYFIELNQIWTDVLGWTIEELKSRPWLEFIHPHDIAVTENIDLKCYSLQAEKSLKIVNRFLCKNGNYRWFSWRFSAYDNELSYGITKDITQNHWRSGILYQNDIQQALNLRDKAIEASNVGIVIADAQIEDTPLIYVNSAFEKITGYSPIDVLGKNCRFLQGKDTDKAMVAKLRKAMKEGTHCTVTLLNYRKDGTPYWNLLSISPIYNDENILTHFVGIQTDVSERFQIQEALMLRDKAIEASSVGIVIADAQLRDMPLIYINSAFEKMTGYSREETLSKNCRFLQGKNTSSETLNELRQAINQGIHSTVTLLNYRKDGTPFWNELSISPIYNKENILTHFVGIQSDITQRIQTQEALMLREKAIEASSVGIVIADAQLRDMPLIYINSAFEKITGYSRKDTVGKNCRFLQGENTSQATVNKLKKAIKEGKDCTVILLNYKKDGTPFWNELTISPLYNKDNILTHFIGIQSDVTQRINANKALKLEKAKSEKLLLNILPKTIVKKLKEVNEPVAQQFDNASILFADIVGFTPLSASMKPLELINLLNEIFSTFDHLADKHDVEKIKTIGDAYMVAGGLPLPQEKHINSIAQMALDMQEAIKDFNKSQGKSFQIRIGINTGAVVAGVIGQKKFIYDLWGDAVNVASRMESHGIAGKIQVSEEVYQLLKDKFVLEKRGLINIKGKGEMTTYWLLGKKD